MMAHPQKPDFVFWRNGRVHLYRWGRQFSRLLAAEVCASAVVMLDTACSEVVWRVLATHSILQFPLQFPSCASPCAITFQLESTTGQVTFDNMGHALCELDDWGYRHTLVMCNTNCFSMATLVSRTRFDVTIVRALRVLYYPYSLQ